MTTEAALEPPPLPSARPAFARPGLVALGALGVGFAVDSLALRRPPGIGLALAMVVGVAIVGAAQWPQVHRTILGSAAAMAAAMAWRASPTVSALSFCGYAVLIAIALRQRPTPPIRTWALSDYVWQGIGAAASVVAGVVRFARHDASSTGAGHSLRRLAPWALGALVALPVLAVFASLFASADAVFADYVERIFNIDVELARAISRVITSILLGAAAVGAWRAVRDGDTYNRPSRQVPAIPAATAAVVIGSVGALFAMFVTVQARYLFGGADTLAATGLTYSEYARRGFFEMVVAVFLVLVLISFVDWLAHATTHRFRLLDALSAILVILTFGVVASAALRMRLYTDAFGLTELRFYTSVFMAWTTVVLVLYLATVVRGRRELFAFGMLISGVAFIVGMALANPDRIIATVNLERHVAGAELDVAYLRQLSADAVPVLVDRIDDTAEPCRVTEAVRAVLSAERADGWRSSTIATFLADRQAGRLPDC